MTFTRGELKVNPMFTHFYMYISILAVKKYSRNNGIKLIVTI